jgi:hypothetical protein
MSSESIVACLDVESLSAEIDEKGYVIVPSNWPDSLLSRLRDALGYACDECEKIQSRNQVGQLINETSLSGAAHHLLPFSDVFVELLEQPFYFPLIEHYLGGKVILNNAGGFINVGQGRYQHALSVHRDVRTVSQDYGKQMLLVLITLDEFTEENGATYLLPGSHRMPEKPTNEEFIANSVRAVAPAGTLVIFDARLWHSAGVNRTARPRRAITYGFTRPFFKPQFDYCRALGWDNVSKFSPHLQQVLGYFSRIPSNHDEWYRPMEERFYRRGQG